MPQDLRVLRRFEWFGKRPDRGHISRPPQGGAVDHLVDHEERIRAAGCDGYVVKPLAYKAFLATIAEQLAQGALPEELTQ